MAYIIKARFYNSPDQFGESYVITSDNAEKDTMFEIGQKVQIKTIGVEQVASPDSEGRADLDKDFTPHEWIPGGLP